MSGFYASKIENVASAGEAHNEARRRIYPRYEDQLRALNLNIRLALVGDSQVRISSWRSENSWSTLAFTRKVFHDSSSLDRRNTSSVSLPCRQLKTLQSEVLLWSRPKTGNYKTWTVSRKVETWKKIYIETWNTLWTVQKCSPFYSPGSLSRVTSA